MQPTLVDVRNKIARADKHFKEIDAAIELALGMEANNTKIPPFEYQPDRKHLIITHPKPHPVDPALPLAIGDCVHNLRSALDHLAFQLAVLNGKEVEAETAIAFPVYWTQSQFDNFADRKVAPFIHHKALAAIQDLQPYKTDNPPGISPLWVLSQLDNIDKHRLLVVVARKVRITGFNLRFPGGEYVSS